MTEEARLEPTDGGLAPATDGWFVVNVRDALWVQNAAFGAACIFEATRRCRRSRRSASRSASCRRGSRAPSTTTSPTRRTSSSSPASACCSSRGEERRLKAWDFFHCPPGTEHIFVGAGEGPCVIFMSGARKGWPEKGVVYPRSESALRHGAGVEVETTSPAEAYAGLPEWRPGPPPSWEGLPWA